MVNAAAVVPEEQNFILSSLSPSRAQRRLALAVVLVLLVVFFITEGPLSTTQTARIDAFVPTYATAMFVTDAITAVLLFAQFSILRSRALLAISTGYLFTALIVIPWTLTFPGVYTPGGLLGFGLQQSTHWLYISWHAGFPMFVVEYANQRGEPQWSAPPNSTWDYTIFGRERPLPPPDERLELLFEKVPGGRGGYNRWTINGKSWPNTNPLFTTERGKRYRLVMTNKSGDNHPVHLHRQTFEVTKVGDKATAGVMKDTINMTRFSTVEIDFIADDPGPSLLHCHHQDHQDEGFMELMTYL